MTTKDLLEIDYMDGHEFEYYCANILRKNGYSNVEVTKGSGDYGIDIFAEKDSQKYAIQCKRFSGKVGNKAVQEALSGKVYYGCDVAVVLTNSLFTEQARETARRTGVILWDRNTLVAMVEAAYPNDAAFSQREKGYNPVSYNKTPQKTVKPKRRVGCLRVFLIIFAIMFVVFLFDDSSTSQESEKVNDSSTSQISETTEKPYDKTSIMLSAINKDENPNAIVFLKQENLENIDGPISAIVDGVCYLFVEDHLEVVGLFDFKKSAIKIKGTIEEIPVTIIREQAFLGEDIMSVSLPDSIVDIQNAAFCSCKKLTKINLPDGITKISKKTFSACGALKSINLPKTVSIIESSAFEGTALSSINLENVVTIEENAFRGSKLTTVKLSAKLLTIGARAFYGCSGLKKIAIPEGTESIGKECFKYCEALKTITLPETLVSIGVRCFEGCEALKEIKIPKSVNSRLDSQLFAFDYALTVIYLPESSNISGNKNPFAYCNARIVFYR